MAHPIVYGQAGSTYVWSARLALAEKGVTHELVEVRFGAHREERASLRRVIVLRVPIRLSAMRARGSQEAGRRSRGVEFAPDSPLEGDGFEPSVPFRRKPWKG
jgi:hypothetical protein